MNWLICFVTVTVCFDTSAHTTCALVLTQEPVDTKMFACSSSQSLTTTKPSCLRWSSSSERGRAEDISPGLTSIETTE